ncbi:MAG: DUF2442 domain-containing protein [Chitinispirillaceae bacterium]
MFHKIVQVMPTDDYKVYLYFVDGKIKLFDAADLVTKGVFRQLKSNVVFKETCTVMNDTLAWDLSGRRDPSDCLDLDPEVLYQSCPDAQEPFKNSVN